MRATLGRGADRRTAFERMIRTGVALEDGVAAAIDASRPALACDPLGCRAEYGFRSQPPRTGAEAAAAAMRTWSATCIFRA